MNNTISHDAQVEACVMFLRGLFTEPMTLGECSNHFGIGRKTMKNILDSIEGVQRLPGGRYLRIPLCEMPIKYLVSRGFFPTVESNSEMILPKSDYIAL